MKYTNSHRPAQGFSLLELLVVLVVVGVVMSGVTIAINQGGPEKELNDIVEKFTAYADYASEMAVITGKPIGLMLEPPGWQENPLDAGWRYRWQQMTLEGWVDYAELPVMDIPTYIALYVTVDEELWDWEDAPEVRLPVVAFYPGGDATLFEIEFALEGMELSLDMSGSVSQHVTLDDWGRVIWKEQAEMLKEIEEALGD